MYREGMKQTVFTKYRDDYSSGRYTTLVSRYGDDLGREQVPELSKEEKEAHDREHVIKANLIYQERVRLGIGRFPDQCPICGSTMNRVDEKCTLCGIKFCAYCVRPEKHNCVIHQYELENHIVKTPEIITEPVITPEVIIEPETITGPIKVDEPVNSKEIDVKEEIEMKKKIPLWRKILFLLGFGKHSATSKEG